jgi:hypothetical protein
LPAEDQMGIIEIKDMKILVQDEDSLSDLAKINNVANKTLASKYQDAFQYAKTIIKVHFRIERPLKNT